MMQPMGYAGAPMGGAPYEFNEIQNATIGDTARYARLWGIISLVSGVLVLVSGILLTAMFMGAAAVSGGSPMLKPALLAAIGISLIPTSLVSILGGIFYMSSGASLQRVVETQGNDIPLLMDAVRALSRAFMIEAIAMMVSFVIGLVVGIVMQTGGHT
jgi:hypothetical protein